MAAARAFRFKILTTANITFLLRDPPQLHRTRIEAGGETRFFEVIRSFALYLGFGFPLQSVARMV